MSATAKTRLGELREYITIQTPTRASDSHGGATETWATHYQTWAKVEPVSARQQFFGEQLEHRITHRFMVRDPQSALGTQMRISWDSRLFYIDSFRDVLVGSRFTVILCEEIAPS